MLLYPQPVTVMCQFSSTGTTKVSTWHCEKSLYTKYFWIEKIYAVATTNVHPKHTCTLLFLVLMLIAYLVKIQQNMVAVKNI